MTIKPLQTFFRYTFPQVLPLKKRLGTFAAIFYLMTSSMNLVDIASKYILLQPSRKALKGKCPFHKDETTSLLIIPQSNVFKCFGCGAEGGPMEFLMRIENKKRIDVIAGIAEKTFPG